MRRKKGSDEGGGPNWLDTYADMVTLLLTFFVLLFSISTLNSQKWEALVSSLAGNSKQDIKSDKNGLLNHDLETKNLPFESTDTNEAVTDPAEEETTFDPEALPENPEEITEFNQLYYYLKQYIKENKLESDIELFKGEGYTFIIFRNSIFFSGDSAELRGEGKVVLDVLSSAIEPIRSQIAAIRFEGHTARAGNQGDPNNVLLDWELSSQRAVNVLTYIYAKNIIEPKKLTAVGHGEHDPIVPHDGSEETRVKNRRVEIYLAQDGEDQLSLSEIYNQLNGQKQPAN